jgi:hypothetical protein
MSATTFAGSGQVAAVSVLGAGGGAAAAAVAALLLERAIRADRDHGGTRFPVVALFAGSWSHSS